MTMAKIWMAGAAALMAMAGAVSAPAQKADSLRIVVVDVEGGAATLFVTPQGKSLLIDAGWPDGIGGPRAVAGQPAPPPLSSAERIVTAARALGLSRIDYLVVTHYHVDHVGGVPDLLRRFPVGMVIDHGPNREELPAKPSPMALKFAPATLYPAYLKAIAGKPHRVMKPGETLKIDDLTLTVVDSDRKIIARPLAGGGEPGADCASATSMARDGGEENARSLGFLATWGKARLLALGDTSWNVENSLVCPNDRIGPVDLMLSDNHGSDISNSPVFVNTLKPRVVVVANGTSKGGDASVLDTMRASPRIEGLWQLHSALRSPDKNEPDNHIVNLAGDDADGRPLKIGVEKSGTITVSNPRTGHSESYAGSR
jgi:beta-lactamase superfamily II metal-dependent hydrolase